MDAGSPARVRVSAGERETARRRAGETQDELLEVAVEAARMAGGLLLERVRSRPASAR